MNVKDHDFNKKKNFKPACLYGVFRTLLKLTYLAYSTAY